MIGYSKAKQSYWYAGALLLALSCLGSTAAAQLQKACTTTATAVPCVDKIDPPGWWATLPSPRLLLHGNNLGATEVTIRAKGAIVAEVRASENGRYLFVQLNTEKSSAQTLTLHLRNAAGNVEVPYTLEARDAKRVGYQGFSSRDAMYLIMPDRYADGDRSNDPPAADRAMPGTWHGGDLRGIQQHLDYLKDLGATTIWMTPIVSNTPADAEATGRAPQPPPTPAATPRATPGGAAATPPQSPSASLAAPPPPNKPAMWPPQPYAPAEAQAGPPRVQRPSAPRRYSSYHGYGATDLYAVDPHLGSFADFQQLAEAVHAHGMKLVLDMVPNHVGAAHPWAADSPTPDWFHGTAAHHTRFKTEFYSLPDPHSSWAEQKDIVNGWFGTFPDLNQENPLVTQYLIQNAMWWIESAGIDGFRIDTFSYVGRKFWQDYHTALNAVYPRFTTVGEVYVGDPVITSFFAGGVPHDGVDTGLWTPFDFPVYETLRKIFTHGAPMYELEDVLRDDRLYPHPERLVTFIGNHDTSRLLNEPGVTPADVRMAMALMTTMRGMPQLYAGDEIAMKGGRDPDNRRDFPGGFPGDTQNAFTVNGRTAEQNSMFQYVRGLLHFRAEQPSILSGKQQDLFRDETVFGFVRADDTGHGCTASAPRVLVLANHAHTSRSIQVPVKDTALEGCTTFTQALGAASPVTPPAGASLTVQLAADDTAVYVVR